MRCCMQFSKLVAMEVRVSTTELESGEIAARGLALGALLEPKIAGAVIVCGDARYDAARTVFNAMIDRRPAVIAQCTSLSDVAACVTIAEETGTPLSVRGGGHNVAGNAICPGGLVIDLTQMRAVEVSPEKGTARVQGGATWRDYDRETQRYGLANPGGIVSTTGVGGLTLGGGIGVLRGMYGLASDNLIRATVVTSQGRVVTADEDEHADLLWGLRGGGGNFGVVTQFEFQAYPVDEVTAGLLVFRSPISRKVLHTYNEVMATAPPEFNCDMGLRRIPDGDFVVAAIPTYFGRPDEAEKLLAPLIALEPQQNTMRPMSYCDAQQQHDVNWPFGQRHYWRSTFLDDLAAPEIDTILDWFPRNPSSIGAMAIEHFHGRVTEIHPDKTAFRHRGSPFNLLIETRWVDAADDDANVAWARGFSAAMQPLSTGGVYVNYLGHESDDRVLEAYGERGYQRLQGLKRVYDPGNIFSSNQNVKVAV